MIVSTRRRSGIPRGGIRSSRPPLISSRHTWKGSSGWLPSRLFREDSTVAVVLPAIALTIVLNWLRSWLPKRLTIRSRDGNERDDDDVLRQPLPPVLLPIPFVISPPPAVNLMAGEEQGVYPEAARDTPESRGGSDS